MAIKKARQLANEARNNKIESMDIDELKKYLCMKHGQNPEKCDGCSSVKSCVAGQRAVVLIGERAARKAGQAESPVGNGADVNRDGGAEKSQSAYSSALEATRKANRETFEEACQQEDMVEWLEKHDCISRNAAVVKLKYWSKAHPDIAERYGYAEKYAAMVALNRKKGSSGRVNPWNELQREKARAEYLEAMTHEDPAAWIAEKRGTDRKNAVILLCKWKKNYGSVEKQPGTRTDGEPENSEEKENTPMADGNGEVSIEDFLNEVGGEASAAYGEENRNEAPKTDAVTLNGTASYQIPITAVYMAPLPDMPPVARSEEPEIKPAEDMRGKLVEKASELEAEKKRIDAEIERLRDRRGWIEKAQDALAMTMNLFDPDSAIGKDFGAKG